MGPDAEFFQKISGLYQGSQSDFPWYCFAALIFQIHDEMDLVGQTWLAVLETCLDKNEQIRMSRQLRESLLKASVLVGFPKGINALTTLRKTINEKAPQIGRQLDDDQSLRQSLQRMDKDTRGRAFWDKLYAQHSDRVLQSLSVVSGGDLAEFAINAVYGDLMAETSRLNAAHTCLLEFLACYATAGSVAMQAKSHMYGAHNMGNTGAEIKGAVAICDAIEAELGIRVDRTGEQWKWLAKADSW
ncbi:hypothetical protein E8E13_007418 [Curvularia kusanoi]|uniref:Uncharacterized protein n=1 Tax=Curvularia kusanoi TaxID=90978 RepID=A0A9P4TFL7_CURKU|nr:hypothetical protein E8E13_007418 [Curvularia kusanoi]